MKISLKHTTQVTRRLVLGALGSWSLFASAGRVSAAPASPVAPVKPLCIECLAKRARQRSAFISKWV